MTATTPASTQRKKRPTTYGKKIATPTAVDLGFFDGEYATPSYANKQSDQSRRTHTPSARSIDAKLNPATVVTKAQSSTKDAFDLPSSEDESRVKYVDRPLQAKVIAKRPLFDDRGVSAAKASTWSDKRPRLNTTPRKSVAFAAVEEPAVSTSLPVHVKRIVPRSTAPANSKRSPGTTPPAGSSAIERLKYRKAAPEPDAGNSTSEDDMDVVSSPANAHDYNKKRSVSPAIFASQASKRTHTTYSATSASPMPLRHPATKSPQAKITVQAEEASSDTEMNEPRPTTPTKSNQPLSHSTPSRSSLSTARGNNPGGLTPKQDRLWQDLFNDISDHDTEREPRMPGSSAGRRISGSPFAETPRSTKARLVDQLRAAASSDVEDDHSDEASSDIVVHEEPALQVTNDKTATTSRRSAPQSFATRLTYTQQRSHLAEENEQDNMLMNLAHNTLSQSASNLSNSAFDLDDDFNTGSTKLRSVHELRARGKSSRAIAELDELLHDAEQLADLPRHLTALIKLAAKLLDDESAKTFLQHNHETRLMKLTPQATDELSKALLLVSILLLLTHDLPRSVSQRLKDILIESLETLHITTDLSAVCSAHKVSLGRSSLALSTLMRKVSKHNGLWVDETPHTLSVRTLYLRAIDLAVGKLRRNGDTSALLANDVIITICPPGFFKATSHDRFDTTIVISLLESLSISNSPLHWPASLIEAIATIPTALEGSIELSPHSRFLAYRLCLNVTKDGNIDHFLFARAGALKSLPQAIVRGFEEMYDIKPDAEARKLNFDLLILAIAILINLSEYSKAARHAILQQPSLVTLVHIFKDGHERARQAESEDESTSNVAFGYLAVMLANFCQETSVRDKVRLHLEGQKLDSLVEAVEEFVMHHQRVDRTDFADGEGQRFTVRLQQVLSRLKKYV